MNQLCVLNRQKAIKRLVLILYGSLLSKKKFELYLRAVFLENFFSFLFFKSPKD